MTVHWSAMQPKRNTRRDGWNPPKLNDLSHVQRCPAFVNILTQEVSKQVANEHISTLRDPRKAFITKDSPSSSPILGNASDTYLRFLSKLHHPSNASANYQCSSDDTAIASGVPIMEKEYARWILYTDPYISKTEIEEQTKFPAEEDVNELNDRFDNLVRNWLREFQKENHQENDSKKKTEDQEIGREIVYILSIIFDTILETNIHKILGTLEEYQPSLITFHRLREQGMFGGSLDAQNLDGLRSNPTRRFSSLKKVSAIRSYSRDEFLSAVKYAARMHDRERSITAARRKEKLESDQFLNTDEYRIKFTSIVCSLLVNFKLQGYTWEEDSMSLCLKQHDKSRQSDSEEVKFVGFLKYHLESRRGSGRLFYDTVVARLIDQGVYHHFYRQPESRQWMVRDIVATIGKIIAKKKSSDSKIFADENRFMIEFTAAQLKEELGFVPASYKLTREDALSLIVEVTTRIELNRWQDDP